MCPYNFVYLFVRVMIHASSLCDGQARDQLIVSMAKKLHAQNDFTCFLLQAGGTSII